MARQMHKLRRIPWRAVGFFALLFIAGYAVSGGALVFAWFVIHGGGR